MVLDVFQTNTAKPHPGGLFPSRPSWDESWTESWKQCRLDEHQLMTVFIFYQLVLQRTALPQCTADMYPGGDECPSAIKMRRRRSHSLTSAIISHWANGLQLQWLGSRSFFLPSDRPSCCHGPPPPQWSAPSPFSGEKWSSAKSCDWTRRLPASDLHQVALSSGELQVYYWKVYYYGRHISAARVDHWRSLSNLARAVVA